MFRNTFFKILDDRYEGDYSPRNNRGNVMAVEDEYDPAATRTLFVGNIEKTTTYGDLKEAFERYGEIVVSKVDLSSTSEQR